MTHLQCCCGKLDCAYLEHNNSALTILEKDVETAAQLGQALLSRHESYMLESEEERRKMAADMERLKNEKQSLESENARVEQENQDLLQQLEGMNTQIADSDAHIESLMATLCSAQFENKRLMALAARTADLEAQLAEMELGRASLQQEVAASREEEQSALQRWKTAEARLSGLNEQVEMMERDARDEREKHVTLVGQMERRNQVERELESAAGRLKGAAAASSLGRDKKGTNVVSHFVQDILQDNANLQAGIVELRELLETSNGEVQNLREQVLRHQPLPSVPLLRTVSLSEEMEQCQPQATSQEVHVHHHYHANFTGRREKGPSSRRPPRRRGIGPSTSSNVSTGWQTPISRPGPNVLAFPRQGSQVNRWSTQSSATDISNISSSPTSPYSENRCSSIFDRIDPGFETSRPTSPESVMFSPKFHSASQPSLSEPDLGICTRLTDVSEVEPASDFMRFAYRAKLEPKGPDENVRREQEVERTDAVMESPTEPSKRRLPPPDSLPPVNSFDVIEIIPPSNVAQTRPFESRQLRRSGSHESLVSISGMDIHLPQKRNLPLRLLSKPSMTFGTVEPLNFSIAFPSSRPLASIVEVNASSSNVTLSPAKDSLGPISLLSGLANGRSPPTGSKGFGGLVENWVRGKWGIAPRTLAGLPREQATLGDSSARSPGINQKGAIVGLKAPPRITSDVHAKVLDERLLHESLAE